MLNLDVTSYPPGAPLSGRADWRPAQGNPAPISICSKPGARSFQYALRHRQCHSRRPGLVPIPTMAAPLPAINDWIAKELLDREPRLRARRS